MITQLNATYVPLEDRVLFKFNTSDSSEFRLWLTRNMVREIMSVCTVAAVKAQELQHPVAQAQSIAEFKQQAVEQATAFTEYKPADTCPLGETPVLVNRLQMRIEGVQYVLVLGLVIGKDLTMRMNEDLLAKTRLLLNTIQEKAQWGLVVNSAAALTMEPAGVDAALPSVAPLKILH
jgi:hypothetical protein